MSETLGTDSYPQVSTAYAEIVEVLKTREAQRNGTTAATPVDEDPDDDLMGLANSLFAPAASVRQERGQLANVVDLDQARDAHRHATAQVSQASPEADGAQYRSNAVTQQAPAAVEGVIVNRPAPAAADDADDEDELGSPLPEWMRSRASAKGLARKLYRRARYHLVFHAIRSPVYASRWTLRCFVGIGRAIAHGWNWALDRENKVLRRTMVASGEGPQYAATRAQPPHQIKVRLWPVTAVAAGITAGLAWAQSQTSMTTPGASLVALTALGLVGRPKDGAAGVLDHPDVPLTVELTTDHLDKAFRAAGLLDKEASLVLIQPIMRD